jgi:hypothetical protein
MSVSVRHDSSFREEIGFIILQCKYKENIWIGNFFLGKRFFNALLFFTKNKKIGSIY